MMDSTMYSLKRSPAVFCQEHVLYWMAFPASDATCLSCRSTAEVLSVSETRLDAKCSARGSTRGPIVTLEPPKADASQGDLFAVFELGVRWASSRVEVLDSMAVLWMMQYCIRQCSSIVGRVNRIWRIALADGDGDGENDGDTTDITEWKRGKVPHLVGSSRR